MKLKKEITITEIADEFVAVPLGEAAEAFKGVIRLNKTGKEIMEGLIEGKSEDLIVESLLQKYEGVDAESAFKYVGEITAKLEDAGLLERLEDK